MPSKGRNHHSLDPAVESALEWALRESEEARHLLSGHYPHAKGTAARR